MALWALPPARPRYLPLRISLRGKISLSKTISFGRSAAAPPATAAAAPPPPAGAAPPPPAGAAAPPPPPPPPPPRWAIDHLTAARYSSCSLETQNTVPTVAMATRHIHSNFDMIILSVLGL